MTNAPGRLLRREGEESRVPFSAIEVRIIAAAALTNAKNTDGDDRCSPRAVVASPSPSPSSSSSRSSPATVAEARDGIFELGAVLGRTCELFLSRLPRYDPPVVVVVVAGSTAEGGDGPSRSSSGPPSSALLPPPPRGGGTATTTSDDGDDDRACAAAAAAEEEEAGRLFGMAFLRLFALSNTCGIDLRECVLAKVELNGRKYPVELCRVS